MKRLFFVITLMIITGFSLSSIAAAKPLQTKNLAQSSINFIYECAEISNSAQRLTCFDQAVSKLRTSEHNKQIIVINAKQAKTMKREAFGFNLPSLLPQFGSKKQKEELIDTVKIVRKLGKKHIITLNNGQVWREIGSDNVRIPKGELTATIKPKALGSFLMSLDNGKRRVSGLRVKRVK